MFVLNIIIDLCLWLVFGFPLALTADEVKFIISQLDFLIHKIEQVFN